MAPFRKERMASFIREIVSETIAQKLHDPRITAMTTVTRVQMSPDLQIATVYLSVRGELKAEKLTLEAVRHASGFIQRRLAKALNVRICPGLRFAIDEQLKGAQHIMQMMEDNRKSRPAAIEEALENESRDREEALRNDSDRTDEKEGRE